MIESLSNTTIRSPLQTGLIVLLVKANGQNLPRFFDSRQALVQSRLVSIAWITNHQQPAYEHFLSCAVKPSKPTFISK